jgi:hypothetical protein
MEPGEAKLSLMPLEIWIAILGGLFVIVLSTWGSGKK